MKKVFTIMCIIVLCCLFCSKAEELSFYQYLQKYGFTVYSVDTPEAFGMDADTFDGMFSDCSLLGCVYGSNKLAFFGRDKGGKLFTAQNPYQDILGAVSPLMSDFYMIGVFVDACEKYDFSIGLYIDSNGFHFGLSEKTDKLILLASKLGSGHPTTAVVGWENFRTLILFH